MLVDKDMKCLICNSGEFVCIHKGTRDVPHINVMKCQNCGMVQLDCRKYNTEENYTGGGYVKEHLCGGYGYHIRYVLGIMGTGNGTR